MTAELYRPELAPNIVAVRPTDAWLGAVHQACEGLSAPARRSRRLAARRFEDWCQSRSIHPAEACKSDVEAFLSTIDSDDAQAVNKARCNLRKVLEALDPHSSRRTLGLGSRTRFLARQATEPVGRLVEIVVQMASTKERQAVRRSSLATLFAWADEVGVQPIEILAGDMPQFRAWLPEVHAMVGETMVVARDFLELRHSPEGRTILGEPEPEPPRLKIGQVPALRPRFRTARSGRCDRSAWLHIRSRT